MVRIRLQRRGRRKRPIHHVVVADSREPRDGRIIEDLGRFNNLTAKNEVDLDEERAIYWLKQGAQPSDTVRSIFRHQGILYKMHLIRWDKSEEEIEEALAEWRENREQKQETSTAKQKQKAMLEAEEKEYQKQLQKKAEEAAKEREKQEALEEAEAEEDQEEQEDADEEEQVEAAEETSEEQEQEEDVEESAEAADTDEEPEESAEAAEDEEESAEAEQEAADAEEEKQEAAEAEESEEEPEEEQEQVSSDMLAKDAIKHIKETPAEELEGFVTDDESRVTVQRAWEEKQEE